MIMVSLILGIFVVPLPINAHIPTQATNQILYPSPGDVMFRYLTAAGMEGGHVAIFYRYRSDGVREIMQAVGPGSISALVGWNFFMNDMKPDTSYWGSYCQTRGKTLQKREELIDAAYDCIGIAYPAWPYLIGYKDHPTTLRCDGLVEWTYEHVFNEPISPDETSSNNTGIVPQDYSNGLGQPVATCPIHGGHHNMCPTLQLEWLNNESQAVDGHDISGPRHGEPSYNSSPILLNATVIPSNGSPSTKFYFTTTYIDNELDEPNYSCSVIVDGNYYNMSNVGETRYNGEYRYPSSGGQSFSVGEHHYYFYFRSNREGQYDTVRYPASEDLIFYVTNLPTTILVSEIVNPSTCEPYQTVNVSGSAVYDNGPSVTSGTVTITISGVNVWTTPLDVNGNYSRNITAPGSNGNYSVNVSVSDGSIAGTTSQSLQVQPGGGGSGYTFYRSTVCRDVDDPSPYDPIHETIAFNENCDKVYVWVHLTDIYKALTVKWKWYKPDGSLYKTNTFNVPDPSSEGYDSWDWYKCWYWLSNISDIEGEWSCRLYVDDGSGYDRCATEKFVIRYDLTEHKMCKDIETSDPYDPINPTNTFYQTDNKAMTWMNMDVASIGAKVKWQFYEPAGSLYSSFEDSGDAPTDDYWDWYKFWGWINITGHDAVNKCGNWQVKVLIEDPSSNWDEEYVDYFQILESPDSIPIVDVTVSPEQPIEGTNISLNISATDNTYLQKVTLYWNDGTQHIQTWDSIFSSSFSNTKNIGTYSAGQSIWYYAKVYDTSENEGQSILKNFVVLDISPNIVVIPDTLRFKWDGGSKKETSLLSSIEDTIFYDNGTPSYIKPYDPSDVSSCKYYGVKFTPTEKTGSKVTGAKVYIGNQTGSASTFEIHVYDDNGGNPGTLKSQGTFNVGSSSGYFSPTLSTQPLIVGDFYIFVGPQTMDANIGIGLDNGLSYADRMGATDILPGWYNPGYPGDFVLRANVTYESSDTCDTVKTMIVTNNGNADLTVSNITKNYKWITSITPTNFTLIPGDSQNVIVTVACNGLSNGTNIGSLSIFSNDTDENPYIEPVKFVVTSVGTEEKPIFPGKFVLFSPSPNPSMAGTVIKYGLPEQANVSLKLYDASGRLVKNFCSDVKEKGYYTANIKNGELNEGIYFIKFVAGNFKATRKLTILR